MPYTFSLSLAAVDILLEHGKLGRAPFPFNVPHIGTTHTQRAQVRGAVFRDLESRGLMRGGRLDADVDHSDPGTHDSPLFDPRELTELPHLA